MPASDSARLQTASSFENFILAMTLYPDVMRSAQAELDKVVGRGRLPTFADRPNLPYIEAIYKEALRWRPTSALCECSSTMIVPDVNILTYTVVNSFKSNPKNHEGIVPHDDTYTLLG